MQDKRTDSGICRGLLCCFRDPCRVEAANEGLLFRRGHAVNEAMHRLDGDPFAERLQRADIVVVNMEAGQHLRGTLTHLSQVTEFF